jgi:beta-mannosidase
MTGKILAQTEIPFALAPREARRLTCAPMSVSWPDNRNGEFLVVETGDVRILHFFEPDKSLEYPAAEFDSAVERTAQGYRVTVTAKTLVRDLTLFADRLDPRARVDVQMLNLLPGEAGIFNIVCETNLDPRALTAFPVLQALN